MERALAPWALSIGLVICTAAMAAGQSRGGRGPAADAETHKAWMNDAADAQEDIREALAAADGAKVRDGAVKIEAFMALTEEYWAAKKADDIVKLAQASRALARETAAAATAGKMPGARSAFDKLSASCNACHDLHPEKR